LSEGQRRVICSRLGPRVTAVAQDTRGQARNRELALERLAEKLERALRPRRSRRATRPTRASKERRLEQKRRQGARKRDRRFRSDD
jgi:ribosome-associated protein